MTIATLIDYFLYAIVAATVAVVVFKSLELWFPQLIGQGPFEEQLQSLSESEWSLRLERGLTFLQSVAHAAPFIGLMGTVLHIMHALSLVTTSLDTAIISGPIATALGATLIGLASAVPASIATAFFVRRIEVLETRYIGSAQ